MKSGARASVSAVVAAAGSGERLGAGGPKAFVPLAGRPMVEWSLAAFKACAAVEAIVVACPPGHAGARDFGQWLDGGSTTEPEQSVLKAGVEWVEGGATRSQSVASALAAVGTDLVAIHDAARPLVTPRLIDAVVAALVADPDADGAIAATPVTDTIKRASAQHSSPPDPRLWDSPTYGGVNSTVSVVESVDRGALWAAQTPQVFRTEALRRALQGYPADGREPTDEATIVEAAGKRVLIYPSPPENLKVTTPLDLELAEFLLARREPSDASPRGAV